ncbi:hypothetical protein EYF80_028089 [Liparis tanakae]|uniref:Uncharacterized protein n=1 Tax=Liparis tanakae TaxID=230148 RepID=A0A4Z2H730_9TELE|nr:hypothetical protein EYF80_028089 [Liparis tanakae]
MTSAGQQEVGGAERRRAAPSERRVSPEPCGGNVSELGDMSKAQRLRRLVHQRLTAAAQEICGLLEGAMSEYEEELCALKEENQRNRKLLDAVLSPEVRVQRADVQQLLVVQEVPPEPQGCRRLNTWKQILMEQIVEDPRSTTVETGRSLSRRRTQEDL